MCRRRSITPFGWVARLALLAGLIAPGSSPRAAGPGLQAGIAELDRLFTDLSSSTSIGAALALAAPLQSAAGRDGAVDGR